MGFTDSAKGVIFTQRLAKASDLGDIFDFGSEFSYLILRIDLFTIHLKIFCSLPQSSGQ